MTGSELITEITDIVGKSENATAISGAQLKDRVVISLNFAQKRIARAWNFDELNETDTAQATVDGTKEYDIVSTWGLTDYKDINDILLVDGENSIKIDRWTYRKFDKYYPRPENFSEDRPRIYTIYKRKVIFFKVPDDAYTLHIRYSRWATDLADDGTASEFLNKDQLLVTAGVMETYMNLQEYADAKIWFSRFAGQMEGAIGVENPIDWAPQGEQYSTPSFPQSGSPWTDPFGSSDDPLWGKG